MAQAPPIIQDGILTDLRDGSALQIVVDSSDWFTWLQSASTFTFRGEQGFFTAHKERAGHRRGKAYWQQAKEFLQPRAHSSMRVRRSTGR
jgi:hypothetical protein